MIHVLSSFISLRLSKTNIKIFLVKIAFAEYNNKICTQPVEKHANAAEGVKPSYEMSRNIHCSIFVLCSYISYRFKIIWKETRPITSRSLQINR